MSASAAVGAKVCIVCGQDCSAKPRTKDPQGRHTCKECFDKLAAKRAQAPASPASRPAAPPKPAARPAVPPAAPPVEQAPGEDAVMAGLLKDVPAMTETCPSCGAGMLAGAAVCTMCGYNKETGRTLAVKTLKAPKEKRARTGPGVGEILLNPTYTGLAAVVVFGGLFAMAFVTPLAAAVYILLALVYGAAFGLAMIVDAFRQETVAGLLYLFVPLYALYYVLARCESGFLKLHFWLSIVVSFGIIALGPALQNAAPGLD